MRSVSVLVLPALVLAVVGAAPVSAPKSHMMGYLIESNDLETNLKTEDFNFPVKVKFSRPGTDIVGDRAHGNSGRKLATFEGNVVLHQLGALPVGGKAAASSGADPSTLTCDRLDVDGLRKLYAATGHVHFTQADKSANADHGTLDDTSHILHLDGNVHIARGDSTLDGNQVDYNIDTGEVHSVGSPVIMKAPIPPPSPGPIVPTKAPKKKK